MNSIDQHPSPVRDITSHAQIRDLQPLVDKHSRVYSLPDRNGEIVFTGELLGNASSRVEQHVGHRTSTTVDGFLIGTTEIPLFAAKGDKCKACRWTETHIFRVTEDTFTARTVVGHDVPDTVRYLIHTMGPSIVPGEFNKCRTEWASTGHEVVELLTVRTSKSTYLTASSARALAIAAGKDRMLEEAYVNRAVI